MRCKPGDLAIVVNDIEAPINNGALVRVLKRADPEEYNVPEIEWECQAISTIGYGGGGVAAHPGEDGVGYRDRELHPLRPSAKQDETLTWKPIHEPA